MYMMKKALAALALALSLVGCKDDKQKLYVYNWADYIDPEVILEFEKANNCSVVID